MASENADKHKDRQTRFVFYKYRLWRCNSGRVVISADCMEGEMLSCYVILGKGNRYGDNNM